MLHEGLADLRTRLLSAAMTALENGEEIGLRAVARAAGVSAMAPYRHFRDKAALLEAVAAHGFEDLQAVLQTADRKADPAAALVAQGQAYIAFARAHPALFRLMFSGHGKGPPRVDDNAYGVMMRRVREIAQADQQAVALACWSAVHGLATLALDGGLPDDSTELERRALTIVVGGFASRGSAEA